MHKQEIVQLFHHLVNVAMSDNFYDAREEKLLQFIGKRLGLTSAEVEGIFQHPEYAAFERPASLKERLEYLYSLVSMMMIDGVLHPQEREMCERAVAELGLSDRPDIVDTMIEKSKRAKG